MEYFNIDNVHFGYKNNQILSNINISIAKGEFVAILGESGCGKSTLLKLLAGFEQVKEGNISVEEKIYNSKDVIFINKKIAVMFQAPPLLPWLNVIDNVSFGNRLKNSQKTTEEAIDIAQKYLQAVELDFAANKYPFELSGGMKQRAFLAKVLSDNKDIILMDEPFGALDAFTREKMQILIKEIWQKYNKTVIFITHDIDEALLLASRIIKIQKVILHIKFRFLIIYRLMRILD